MNIHFIADIVFVLFIALMIAAILWVKYKVRRTRMDKNKA